MSNRVRTRIYGDKISSGSGSGGGGAFNGQRPITRVADTIFEYDPATTTVAAFLEKVFYPAQPPLASISVNNPIREIGASDAYTLTWSVTEQTNVITGINVDGTVITPTGGNQGGTQSGTLPATSGSYTKSMTATDGTLTANASCTIEYLARMFWGTTNKDGLSDAPILDSDILALANSNLQATRDLNLTDFGGGATYLIFAIPTILGIPTFNVNGFFNNAFTAVRYASNFVNAEGATVLMDVWVSNNLYNSPLASVILS